MLEMNIGYSPGGTLRRHPLEFSRLLDAWSSLSLPLWLSISAPNSDADDPLAHSKATVSPGSWTAAAQRGWVARFVPLALAKPMVQGVLWNQLRDNELHDFPNGGLFDDRRHRKPAMRLLGSIRHKYLK